MIVWLYSLSDTLIVLLFVVVIVTLVVLLPRQLRRVARMRPDTDAADWAVRASATLITTCIFVLGFSLVQTQSAFHKVDQQVASEASSINQLDRLLTRYGDPKLAEARGALLAYARSIVTDEWPLLREGHRSDATQKAYGPVSRLVLAIDPGPGRQSAIYAEMVRKVDDITEMRETRIENSEVALPAVFWRVIVAFLAIFSVMTCLIEQNLARNLAMSAQVAAISALLALVFISDRPFMGQTSVKPTALMKTIDTMAARKN